MSEMLNKITVWQILTIFVTNRFPLCVANPLPEMCEMLNKITGWQILTILWRTDFPYAWPPPSNYPAHALRYPSQSGDLKVKCPSNRTVTSNGPLMSVCMCVWGPDQLYDLIKLNNVFYLYECEWVCVCGLFRYLTQLPPPPPHPHPRGFRENKGWRGYSSGSAYTVFNIFTHVIKIWSGIFTIFSLFTLWRLEGLLEELKYYFLSFYSSLRGSNIRVGSKIFLRKSAHTDYFCL